MEKLPIKNPFKNVMKLLLRGQFSLSFDQLEFFVTDLHIRKRLNLIAQGVQMTLQSVNRVGFPPILQIEPANICNLRCLTCATGAEIMKRPAALMPFEMYSNVIDQVKDYVCLLAFWSWGEPFINKDAYRMIRYAKDRGVLVHTSTNGHFFNTRERARQVIESGLDSLIVAVDGLDQPTYEKYRRGGKLKLVISSIKNLVAERDAAGARHPLIIFRFIVMKHNEHQINQVKDFAERLGVDVVTFRSAVVKRKEVNLGEDLIPFTTEYKQHDNKDISTKEHHNQRNHFFCRRPYANLTIFSNGDVVSCENDYNATVPFGNVANQSLREILSSHKPKSFLKTFCRNKDKFSFCRECEMPNMKQKTANVSTSILNCQWTIKLTQ